MSVVLWLLPIAACCSLTCAYSSTDYEDPRTSDWRSVSHLVDMATAELLSEQEGEERAKRDSHSLSIVNPLDVLRQRLMLEMARRRMSKNQEQIRENDLILKNLGKRTDRRMHGTSSEFEV